MQITGRWVKYERWSAHDSDNAYYYSVFHEGKTTTVKNILKPLEDAEVLLQAALQLGLQKSKPQPEEVTLEMNDAAAESLRINFDLEFQGYTLTEKQAVHRLLGQLIRFETQQ